MLFKEFIFYFGQIFRRNKKNNNEETELDDTGLYLCILTGDQRPELDKTKSARARGRRGATRRNKCVFRIDISHILSFHFISLKRTSSHTADCPILFSTHLYRYVMLFFLLFLHSRPNQAPEVCVLFFLCHDVSVSSRTGKCILPGQLEYICTCCYCSAMLFELAIVIVLTMSLSCSSSSMSTTTTTVVIVNLTAFSFAVCGLFFLSHSLSRSLSTFVVAATAAVVALFTVLP